MKNRQKVILGIAAASLFMSCQSTSSQTQNLSNDRSRIEIMNTIANDSMMSKQMLETMMNNKIGIIMMQKQQMMMMQNQNSVMKMMKKNPAMMQIMMSAMMETAKGDTIMMSGMAKTMMKNPQMMQNKTGNNNMENMKR